MSSHCRGDSDPLSLLPPLTHCCLSTVCPPLRPDSGATVTVTVGRQWTTVGGQWDDQPLSGARSATRHTRSNFFVENRKTCKTCATHTATGKKCLLFACSKNEKQVAYERSSCRGGAGVVPPLRWCRRDFRAIFIVLS